MVGVAKAQCKLELNPNDALEVTSILGYIFEAFQRENSSLKIAKCDVTLGQQLEDGCKQEVLMTVTTRPNNHVEDSDSTTLVIRLQTEK